MSEQNKQVALKFIEAMGSNDATTAASCLTPDAFTLAKGFSRFAGVRRHDTIVGTIEAFTKLLPTGLRPEIKTVITEGDRVVVEWEGNATTSSGQPYCNQYCMVFTLQDHKIKQVNEYFCTILAEEVLWPLVEAMADEIPAARVACKEDVPVAAATSRDEVNPDLWVWGSNDERSRFLHTMIRVSDFDAALRFYVDGLGMKVLDRFDIESRQVTALFIGYDGYAAGGLLELTRGWDADAPRSHGTGYGHISVGVPDLSAMVAKLEAMGVEITLRPRALMAGGPCVAFVKDPDGSEIELIQTRKA